MATMHTPLELTASVGQDQGFYTKINTTKLFNHILKDTEDSSVKYHSENTMNCRVHCYVTILSKFVLIAYGLRFSLCLAQFYLQFCLPLLVEICFRFVCLKR